MIIQISTTADAIFYLTDKGRVFSQAIIKMNPVTMDTLIEVTPASLLVTVDPVETEELTVEE